MRSKNSDFCSEHCAKSYSNSKRKLSESTKIKIGNSVKQYKISNSSIRDKETHRLKELKRKCCVCGKEFIVPIIKNDRYEKDISSISRRYSPRNYIYRQRTTSKYAVFP